MSDTISPARASNQNTNLPHDEIMRYGRHLIMPEVGVKEQKKLKAASVLIVGAGGLGSPGVESINKAAIAPRYLR